MQLKRIELNKIVENNYNPNTMSELKFNALIKHIQSKGMIQPILVRPFHPKETELNEFQREVLKEIPFPEFEIIDGAHRFRAAKTAGLKEIDCVILDLNEEQAKLTTIAMNNIKGYMQELPLAGILEELRHSINLTELAEITAFKEKEITELLQKLSLPEDLSYTAPIEGLPVTLTFIVLPEEAVIIEEALNEINSENKSSALLELCLKQKK